MQADALDDDIAATGKLRREVRTRARAARVIIWANQWRASKMRPMRYGNKIDHKHSGALTIGIRRNERVIDKD